jgi:ribosomal-protein-alanine N-acetyltransferase
MSRLGLLLGLRQPGARLDGTTIHLRPPERADWAAWCELRSGSRLFLKPWEPSWAPDALTRAAYRRRLARHAADWRDGEAYSFFLIRNQDSRILGGIGLSNARQGYMTEAVSLVVGFAFEQLQLRRLEAACLPVNLPSRRLLERSGFRQEGYAKEYLCIDGVWQDHLLFALLRDSDRWRRPQA